jgi:hypothetical protein
LVKYQMRGGKRNGAGRKKGTPNKATLERQAKVAQEGVTPLEVMLEGMRFHYAMYEAVKGTPDSDLAAASALKEAKEYARDAAPYVHPKLATTEVVGDPDQPVEHRMVVEFVSASGSKS